MADHVVSVAAGGGVRLFVECSCLPGMAFARIDQPTVTLDELNRLAHEHIEAAEADEIRAWGNEAFRSDKIDGRAYGAESAITDPKELVSLLGPEEETPLPFYGDDDPGDGHAL